MDDGWVHTGDIGKMCEDGYISILGHNSDVIITSGMNVYSVTVEEAIQQHVQVGNAADIGVPHDEWGEAVKAMIVPEVDAIDRDTRWVFCDNRLADYKEADVLPRSRRTPDDALWEAR